MGLAKKGSKTITVGSRQYRWRVSPSSGFLDVVVEDAGGAGSRISVCTDYRDIDSESTVQITPSTVREFIEQALHQGWDPAAPGKPRRFHLRGGAIEEQAP